MPLISKCIYSLFCFSKEYLMYMTKNINWLLSSQIEMKNMPNYLSFIDFQCQKVVTGRMSEKKQLM